MAGNSGEVGKVRISSLSAFLMLGAVSATDVKTSFYDYSRPEGHNWQAALAKMESTLRVTARRRLEWLPTIS